ncbi:MAG: sensor histidine kinase [Anaerolineae bacterium]|nr:sensor histidine kinase [Anaerolineae bacterium]
MPSKNSVIPFEIWLSGIYIIVGLTWIFTSDNFLQLFISKSVYELSIFQTLKGTLFVFVTGGAFWLVLRNKRIELEQINETLRLVNEKLKNDIAERERTEKELEAISQQIEQRVAEGREEERQHLARELHDAVTQTLFSASIMAASLVVIYNKKPEQVPDGLLKLQQLTRGAIADMRMLLLELRPKAIEQTNLPQLLKQLCDSYVGRHGIMPELTMDERIILPVAVRHAFYRIAQEALNNIAKHAKATKIHIVLEKNQSTVMLKIHDNGIGFDVNRMPSGTHFGLKIMQERAQDLKAVFHLKSHPAQGTSVYVAWDII